MSNDNKMLYKLIGVIYLAAFVSLYVQFPGLLGINGILPVEDFISRVPKHHGYDSIVSFLWNFLQFPSVVHYADDMGVSVDACCEFLLLLGIVCSVLVSVGYHYNLLWVILWLSYLSLYLVGQVFLGFQWDILLLEVGFLCIIASLFQRSEQYKLLNWCFRFLMWKLMFMAGVVKLQSRCPTWEGLTALEYHFATQCLPNGLSWYVHQLHPLLLRMGVAATLLIEIPYTFLMLAPFRLTRRIGAILQAILQVLIIATGNYNFFNLLALALLVPVWASDSISLVGMSLPQPRKHVASVYMGNALQTIFVIFFVIWSMVKMFEVTWPTSMRVENLSYLMDNVQVRMRHDFHLAEYITPCCVSAMGISVFFMGLQGFREMIHTVRTAPWRVGMIRLVSLIVSLLVGIVYIQVSAIPLMHIGGSVAPYIHPSVKHATSLREFQMLHISSGYGLFRQMTGVGKPFSSPGIGGIPPAHVARPEIIVEGMDSATGEWLEIPFLHKPGNVTKMPTFVVPHQPRLDWHMWFAALGSYTHHSWFINFLHKLLQDDSYEVISLLDQTEYPFKSVPPGAVRATLYEYDFTRLNTSWSRGIPGVELVGTETRSKWWQRRGPGKEYTVAIDKSNESVKKFLSGYGHSMRARVTKEEAYAKCKSVKHSSLLWSGLQFIICECEKLRNISGNVKVVSFVVVGMVIKSLFMS